MSNAVTAVKAAPSMQAKEHFQSSLTFETDCWDVNDALSAGGTGFVLLDVRSLTAFNLGHVPGAINLPVGKLIKSKLAQWPADILIVTYCAGPHCNGATKGAIKLAELGRPCKIMLGGITGWIDEGFSLAKGAQ
ncbi:MAG: rhodanese-like domain-containing protein [Oceanospirillaceae bacterium]|nr:rhodanese-like domain-containing protein [Oceanospirillaceae bacterium]